MQALSKVSSKSLFGSHVLSLWSLHVMPIASPRYEYQAAHTRQASTQCAVTAYMVPSAACLLVALVMLPFNYYCFASQTRLLGHFAFQNTNIWMYIVTIFLNTLSNSHKDYYRHQKGQKQKVCGCYLHMNKYIYRKVVKTNFKPLVTIFSA